MLENSHVLLMRILNSRGSQTFDVEMVCRCAKCTGDYGTTKRSEILQKYQLQDADLDTVEDES